MQSFLPEERSYLNFSKNLTFKGLAHFTQILKLSNMKNENKIYVVKITNNDHL